MVDVVHSLGDLFDLVEEGRGGKREGCGEKVWWWPRRTLCTDRAIFLAPGIISHDCFLSPAPPCPPAQDLSGGKPVPIRSPMGEIPLWGMEIDPELARAELRQVTQV